MSRRVWRHFDRSRWKSQLYYIGKLHFLIFTSSHFTPESITQINRLTWAEKFRNHIISAANQTLLIRNRWQFQADPKNIWNSKSSKVAPFSSKFMQEFFKCVFFTHSLCIICKVGFSLGWQWHRIRCVSQTRKWIDPGSPARASRLPHGGRRRRNSLRGNWCLWVVLKSLFLS